MTEQEKINAILQMGVGRTNLGINEESKIVSKALEEKSMGHIQPSDFINLEKVSEYVTICENKAYNQALNDVLNVVEWDGYTLNIKKKN